MKAKRLVESVVAVVATLGLALSVSACGNSSESGKTTLSFFSWDNEQAMKPYINEFEKENPDIKVDFSYAPPPTEYVQTLQTRLVGNQAPDVFIITSENKAKLMENGYAKDLTNESFMKNIAQANKDFVSKDGKVYGLSTSSWEAGIVYNKDLLAKVGAKSVPTTYDEFISLCKKLKAAGVTPYLESLNSERSRFIDGFMGSLYAKSGTDVTALANSKTDYSKEPAEAVQAWSRLYKENVLTGDAVGMSSDDVKSQFMNGQVAMYSTGAWDFKDLQTTKLNWGFGFMPALTKDVKQYSQGSPSPAYAIYSKLTGDKLKAAEKFLTFMQSEKSLKMQSDAGNAVTVSTFTSSVIKQYKDVYENGIRKGNYFLGVNYFKNPDVYSTQDVALEQQVAQGQLTASQFGEQLNAKMNSLK